MFETSHSQRTGSPASAIWAKWVKPSRWPEWDDRVQSAEPEDDLTEGVAIRVKLRKGGRTAHEVKAIEPGRRLVTEYRLPGARVGHEHIVEQRGPGCELTHRLYVDGPMSWLWATMLGRARMRDTAAGFKDA